jgi:hypothetical protein
MIFHAVDREEIRFNVITASSVELAMAFAKDQVFSQLDLFSNVLTLNIKLVFILLLLWLLIRTSDLFRIYYFRRPVSTYCNPDSFTPKLRSTTKI